MSTTISLRYKLTALFLILVLSFLVNPAFASELSKRRHKLDNVNSQLSQTRQKIEQAKAQEQQLVSQIQQSDNDIESVQKEYDRLDGELKDISVQRANTEKRLSDLQAQLYQTQQDLDNTDTRLKEQKIILNDRVQSIYKHGDESYLDVLLNSSDFVSLLNRIRFLEFIVSQDVDLVERISKTKAAIEEKKLEVEQDKAAVNAERIKLVDEEQKTKELTDEKLAQKASLQAELGKKQSLLNEIQTNRAAYELAEDELLAESQSLTLKIKELEKSMGGHASPHPIGYGSASGFAWPTNGPVTSPFGMRMHPILHVVRMHTGIDIGAPYGQDVVAAQDGVVIQAGWVRGYGQTVIISHGNNISTLYAHLSEILVSDGQSVSKNKVIGRVGSTGLATGPHLHFEVRQDGEPQDPMKWY